MLKLHSIQSGVRGDVGDSDDLDLYVAAYDREQAVDLWRDYYSEHHLAHDSHPDRVWVIPCATITGEPRALEWRKDVIEVKP